MRLFIAAIMMTLVTATTAPAAQEFQTVRDQSRFIDLVAGRDLTRFGIRLKVTPDGGINGKAFGTAVTGQWQWSDGYFCRDLAYGSRDLGANCQMVLVSGGTMRFVSDRGQGIHADLELR